MSSSVSGFPPVGSLIYLSRLLLQPESNRVHSAPMPDVPALMSSRDEFEDILVLAHLNHVDVRWLEMFLKFARKEQNLDWFQLADSALSTEKTRISVAVKHLHEVCAAFQKRGFAVMVIKTLDHWPDFGSDMDLFTTAQPHEVFQLMTECFNARLAPRSWGDHLANKWNFPIPGLPEPIEIHIFHPAHHHQPGGLHTANSLTQTTQWTTLTVGTMVAGLSAASLGTSGHSS